MVVLLLICQILEFLSFILKEDKYKDSDIQISIIIRDFTQLQLQVEEHITCQAGKMETKV